MRISDWSSDVCSSDLSKVQLSLASSGMFGDTWQLPLNNPFLPDAVRSEVCASNAISAADCAAAGTATSPNDQIGRASCRERVCPYVYISVVAVSLNKQNTNNIS